WLAAHGALGAITAQANGGNAGAGALSAAGAELVVSIAAEKMFGDKALDENGKFNAALLSEGEKKQLSALGAATGAALGLAAGGNSHNAQTGGVVAQNAVENNYLTQKEVNDFKDELHSCGQGNQKCIEETFEKYRQISKRNSESMRAACGRGNHGQSAECGAIREEIRTGLAEVFGLNEREAEEYATKETNISNMGNAQTNNLADNNSEGQNLPSLSGVGKRHWWGDEGYSHKHFVTYENLNDYRYLTENRDEAAKIRDYLDNNTFNNTNQDVSLLRPRDLLHWATDTLPQLDYSVPKKIAGKETLPDTSSSVLEQVLTAEKTKLKAVDKGIVGVGRTAKELYEGVKNVVENHDELLTQAEAILTDPEARQKAKDAVAQGVENTVNQVIRTVENSHHALKNGDVGDMKDDLESVGGSVGEGALTGGGIGKAITTTSKGLTTLGKKVGAAIDTDNKVVRATTGHLKKLDCSFRGDMQVRTQNGFLPISRIQVGDMVWSRNQTSGQMRYQRVLNTINSIDPDTTYLTVTNQYGQKQTIVSDSKHPYFAHYGKQAYPPVHSVGKDYDGDIPNAGWIDAGKLKHGYRLLDHNGAWQTVESVYTEPTPLNSYNLEVETDHTFFVRGVGGQEGIWVHNEDCWAFLPKDNSQKQIGNHQVFTFTDPNDASRTVNVIQNPQWTPNGTAPKYIEVRVKGRKVTVINRKSPNIVQSEGKITLTAGSKNYWNPNVSKPKPNMLYETTHGHTYLTDQYSRVHKVEANLRVDTTWQDTHRNGSQQRKSGGADRRADDHGGHLIASMFEGLGEGINIVPMNKVLNGSSGAWYQLEQRWKRELGNGGSVKVKIDVIYPKGGNSKRPEKFKIYQKINGVEERKTLMNTETGY
ncbi:DNA/RNA non-specific endonuclease, partial [Conchiformibius steedae]